MTFRKIICYLGILFFIGSLSAAELQQPPMGGIWVAVRVQETVGKLMEYHGLLENKIFWDIVTQKTKHGFFRLEQVVWVSPEGILTPLSELKTAKQSYGYSNDAFFRVENIYRIIPLDQAFVDNILKRSALQKNTFSLH